MEINNIQLPIQTVLETDLLPLADLVPNQRLYSVCPRGVLVARVIQAAAKVAGAGPVVAIEQVPLGRVVDVESAVVADDAQPIVVAAATVLDIGTRRGVPPHWKGADGLVPDVVVLCDVEDVQSRPYIHFESEQFLKLLNIVHFPKINNIGVRSSIRTEPRPCQ